VTIGPETLIALGSFFAAILAAVYAKATVTAAERANEIAIHSERLKTYKGIVSIHGLLQAKGIQFPEYDFWSKYDYVELTEFYFSKPLADRTQQYFELGKKIVASRAFWQEAREAGEVTGKAAVKSTWDHFNKCLEMGNDLINDFKNELKLH
jgi:hypothetical protein